MELSRRDLLLKSFAIGVIKLSPGMTAASTVGSWLRAESGARPATPTDLWAANSASSLNS